MQHEYWIMRDGSKISVGDMSKEHLQNTLNMVIRSRKKAEKKRIQREMRYDARCDFMDWWYR